MNCASLCLPSKCDLICKSTSLSYPTRPVLNTSSPATEVSWPKENPFILVPSSKIRWAVWAWGRKSRWWASSHPRNNTFSFYETGCRRPKTILGKTCSVEITEEGRRVLPLQPCVGCTMNANNITSFLPVRVHASKNREMCRQRRGSVSILNLFVRVQLQAWRTQTKTKRVNGINLTPW